MDYSIQRRIGDPCASTPVVAVDNMLSEVHKIAVPVFDLIGEKGVLARESGVLPDGGHSLALPGAGMSLVAGHGENWPLCPTVTTQTGDRGLS
jgi:hypothetical protein